MCVCVCVCYRLHGEKEGHYCEYYYHYFTLIMERGSVGMKREGREDRQSDKNRGKENWVTSMIVPG